MSNAARNEGKRKLVGDLLLHVSARKPIVIVIEDIHWADPLILAHLSRMAATVAECPALLIMTSRVEGYPLDQAWRTESVVGLATGIYADRAFDRLPVLADALEDAGCANADVLGHCRGPGPHARGCWVVDLLLGKT